ncbi:MAG: AMP nucleosidase [Pseudomonadota bacterium]
MNTTDWTDYTDAASAVAALETLYSAAVTELRAAFSAATSGDAPTRRIRAYYPAIELKTSSFDIHEPRQSYGYVAGPGIYQTTITRPDLFRSYLTHQLREVMSAHKVSVRVGYSDTPIPIHFALGDDAASLTGQMPDEFDLRDVFDVPDLATINDTIANGDLTQDEEERPLAPFTAQRVDYSLARLSHYTATRPEHFQKFVLFTNYQFYVTEFEEIAREAIGDPESGYESFVGPGNIEITTPDAPLLPPSKLPQMPSYHLKRSDGMGITLVNIGVGPSNAKTATDHIAVLRPHAWVMVGHCGGLRNSQQLGDFVLAHAYVREDHVLDEDLPVWVPIPALAEIQIALQDAVAEITQLNGYDLKQIMRTGTVATIDNRNWELREQSGPVQRLSMSRAIALDMESGTIAANGFRLRVPYGTLLCVSDKPLHGELKLPGMASAFYQTQVSRHLKIGVKAMELLRETPQAQLHSRKLRSFAETAFR